MCLKYANFNPRSLTGATYCNCHSLPLLLDFNPRSLTGATLTATELLSIVEFQSTLPHGSDFRVTLGRPEPEDISIHAPSRERPLMFLPTFGQKKFQSTLPHGSDKRVYGVITNTGEISIHAPSRERLAMSCTAPPRMYFNPRSLTGATIPRRFIPSQFIISIHAPSRERRQYKNYKR